MELTFKEIKPSRNIIHDCKELRCTVDITPKGECDLTAANGKSGITFKNTLTPPRKTSVLVRLWHLKKTEGYMYKIQACPIYWCG